MRWHREQPLPWLGLALAVMTPWWATAAPSFQWGLTAYHIPFASYRLRPDDFSRIAANGIQWISIDLAWRDIEPQPGQFVFDYYDMVLSEAKRHDLHVLARLGNGYAGSRPAVPDWVIPLEDAFYVVALRRYADITLERYKGMIAEYAIENEGNLAAGQTLLPNGARSGRWPPQRVLSVWLTLSQAIRHADPGVPIVLSLSDAPPLANWLHAAQHAGIDYDVVGLQSYVCNAIPFALCPQVMAYDINRAARLAHKPVVMLETGFCPSANYSDERQADYVEMMAKALHKTKAQGVFFYEYLESPEEPSPAGRRCGLVRNDRTPKPAWDRYRQVISALSATPTQPPNTSP